MDEKQSGIEVFIPSLKKILAELLSLLDKHFESMDKVAVTILIGIAVAHQIPGEMVWVRLYGASRSGKTEILRAMVKHSDSAEMEVITPASLRGGFKNAKRLLDRINGKLVITKDFAAMLTAKKETRNELFGVLRNIKDGILVSDFGTLEGSIVQVARFDWIIATTPVFAQYRQMEDLLGARYIDLNWRVEKREEMACKALENNPILNSEIRPKIADAVCNLIDVAKLALSKGQSISLLNQEIKTLIADWADLTALLRSPIARDRGHNVKFTPAAEVATDLAQGLSRVACGLALLGVEDMPKYIARLCQDSIPHDRRALVTKLLKGGIITPDFKKSLSYYMADDLKLLGVLDESDALKPELKQRLAELFSHFS